MSVWIVLYCIHICYILLCIQMKNWKKRFFVLTEASLGYYKSIEVSGYSITNVCVLVIPCFCMVCTPFNTYDPFPVKQPIFLLDVYIIITLLICYVLIFDLRWAHYVCRFCSGGFNNYITTSNFKLVWCLAQTILKWIQLLYFFAFTSFVSWWTNQACWRINTIWGTSGNLPEWAMGNNLWQPLGWQSCNRCVPPAWIFCTK